MKNKTNLHNCPICNGNSIKRCKGSLSIHVKNKPISIPDIEYFLCIDCKETFTDADNESKIDLFLKKKHSGRVA